MYINKTVGVVIRAYNEEKYIDSVINSIPEYVDRIYVVNDGSTDDTLTKIANISNRNSRVIPINREIRGGAGSAAITGQERALQDGIDIIVMLDGDGQMNTRLLNHFLYPLVMGQADYAKGNRLSSREHKKEMPIFRAIGNLLLTDLTRIASGYWHISDPQNGYTAITGEILKRLNLSTIEKGFAFENDILVKLNVIGARVIDVPHPAVYRGQKSKINYLRFIIRTSWVLVKDYFWRIWVKYFKRTGVFSLRRVL